MTMVKLTQIGNSVGIILPKEILAQMGVEKGDELFVTRTPDGMQLSKYDEKIARQVAEGRKIMKKWRHVLRELAK